MGRPAWARTIVEGRRETGCETPSLFPPSPLRSSASKPWTAETPIPPRRRRRVSRPREGRAVSRTPRTVGAVPRWRRSPGPPPPPPVACETNPRALTGKRRPAGVRTPPPPRATLLSDVQRDQPAATSPRPSPARLRVRWRLTLRRRCPSRAPRCRRERTPPPRRADVPRRVSPPPCTPRGSCRRAARAPADLPEPVAP